MSFGPQVRAVGLVLHPTKPVGGSVEAVLAASHRHPVRVLARESDRQRVPAEVETVPDARFAASVDGLIALGGDGTMLGAMRLTIERPVPVLGVNHGNLGFLVEVTPGELPSALARLAAGDFTIEPHACLEAGAGRVELATRFGFNDVVLAREGRSGGVSVDLWVNDVRYGYYRADAVVIATPTGSTAYNYAAGGPILSPSSDALVVTPVAPMAGISRTVVLGAQDRIALTVATDSAPIAVDVDGTASGTLEPGDRVAIALRQRSAQVVRLAASEHASRSRIKLSLLDLPLRPDQLLELIPPELRQRAADGAMGRAGGTAAQDAGT
ncbi:NAD(+)/NADH kinase [Dactylosporangium sp. NPDC051484]|uniref:NAD(+)/NADH kinase n=1 Tax=Dactylosporangium sp. NPDC051484 TaxID=3154942 RepID=UPI003450DFF8